MKRITLLFLFLSLQILHLNAQSNWNDHFINELPFRNELGTRVLGEDAPIVVSKFLFKNIPNLNATDAGLMLSFQNQSPIGKHYDFIQTWKGVKIFGTEIKINISNTGKVMSCFEKTMACNDWNLGQVIAINQDKINTLLKEEGKKASTLENVIFIKGEGQPIQAIKVEYASLASSGGTGCIIIDHDYNFLYRQDYTMHYSSLSAKDSLVKAMVFLPDPLTTANRTYGAPYMDYNDSAVPALDSQRKEVNVVVTYDISPGGKDSFYLLSKHMQLVEWDVPYTGVTWSNVPMFDYNRHQYGFEDINSFYHINTHQQHLHNLGFDSLANYVLKVDAHCSSAGDNSSFVPGATHADDKLMFGTGGVDDAEDADVIIHEYSHCIRNSACPNTFSGEERMASEEGFCDYFACSYSKMLSLNQWKWCFNWDGHNEFWPGRTCAGSKMYPKDLDGEIHDDGEIMSSALMEIADDISRDTADKIMLAAMYSLANNLRMPQVASLYLAADSALYHGVHTKNIRCHFTAHGLDSFKGLCKTGIASIAKANKVKINKSYFTDRGILNINFEDAQSGSLHLYAIDGKLLLRSDFQNKVNLTYEVNELAPGIYIVQIITKDGMSNEKLYKR